MIIWNKQVPLSAHSTIPASADNIVQVTKAIKFEIGENTKLKSWREIWCDSENYQKLI